MREVAKEYGISDTALAKICKKLNIPRPGRGYWARKVATGSAERPPLPPLAQGESPEHRASRWKDPIEDLEFSDEAQALLTREQGPEMVITIPDELQNPHQWIRKSAGTLRQHPKNPDQALLKRACLDIRATRTTLDRALLVADTLLKALDTRGFSVEVSTPASAGQERYGSRSGAVPSKTSVHILDSFIEFSVEEGHDITKIEPKELRRKSSESSDSWTYTPPPEYRHDPNGKLALKINTYIPGHPRRTWSDGKRQRIESCLNAFIIALIRGAELLRLGRVVKMREDEKRKEEHLRRQEDAAQREHEETMRADLISRVGDWSLAGKILEFVAHVESAEADQCKDASDQYKLENWLAWVRSYAKQLQATAVSTVLEVTDPPRKPPKSNF